MLLIDFGGVSHVAKFRSYYPVFQSFYSWESMTWLFMLWFGYLALVWCMCSCLLEPTLQADPLEIPDFSEILRKRLKKKILLCLDMILSLEVDSEIKEVSFSDF